MQFILKIKYIPNINLQLTVTLHTIYFIDTRSPENNVRSKCFQLIYMEQDKPQSISHTNEFVAITSTISTDPTSVVRHDPSFVSLL